MAAMLPATCRSDSIMCPGENLSPIIVEVRDAAAGTPAAQGATGTIRSGDFVSPLVLPAPQEQLRLYSSGGPGVYDVVVQKPGYLDWTREGVRVAAGDCGVERSVVLRADLRRAP